MKQLRIFGIVAAWLCFAIGGASAQNNQAGTRIIALPGSSSGSSGITANSTTCTSCTANGLLYSDGTLVQSAAGVTATNAGTGLAIAQGTITTNLKALNITGTWNAATTFDAPIFENISIGGTNPTLPSLLMDLQLGGKTNLAVGPCFTLGAALTCMWVGTGTPTGSNYTILNNSNSQIQINTTGSTILFRIQNGQGGTSFPFQLDGGVSPINVVGISSSAALAFATTADFSGVAYDIYLQRDAANILSVSSKSDTGTVTSPASMRIYNSASGGLSGGNPANYARISLDAGNINSGIPAIIVDNSTSTFSGCAVAGTCFGLYVGGSLIWDYAVTTNAVLTDGVATTLSNATIKLSGIANTTGTGYVCYGTGGLLTYEAATCPVSIGAAKNLVSYISPVEGLEIIGRLKPLVYTYKEGQGAPGLQEGFFAEDVAQVDDRLVERNEDGSLRTIKYMQMTATLSAAMQALKADNDNLRAEVEALRRSIGR
jgi:hypothetical protein